MDNKKSPWNNCISIHEKAIKEDLEIIEGLKKITFKKKKDGTNYSKKIMQSDDLMRHKTKYYDHFYVEINGKFIYFDFDKKDTAETFEEDVKNKIEEYKKRIEREKEAIKFKTLVEKYHSVYKSIEEKYNEMIEQARTGILNQMITENEDYFQEISEKKKDIFEKVKEEIIKNWWM